MDIELIEKIKELYKTSTLVEISFLLNIKYTTIKGIVDRYKIKKIKNYTGRLWLYEKYIKEKNSIKQLSKKYNYSQPTLKHWLEKHKIPLRSIEENSSLFYNKNKCNINKSLESILIGEILGDGTLTSCSKFSAFYSHGSKYREYLDWLITIFSKNDITIVGDRIYTKFTTLKNKKRYKSYAMATHSYKELLYLYNLFYIEKVKEVPITLNLNPTIVLHWYLGDGSLARHIRGNNFVTIATNGYDINSINLLIDLLNNLGLKSTKVKAGISKKGKQQYVINISAYSTKDFFNYIGPCPKEIKNIYGYKWPIKLKRR